MNRHSNRRANNETDKTNRNHDHNRTVDEAHGETLMGQRSQKEQFATEAEAQARVDKVKASAIPGYSEVYVTGPFCSSGVWMIEWEEFYG